jgi:predicted outer membrane lipoprotein
MIGLLLGAAVGVINCLVILYVAKSRRAPGTRTILSAVAIFDLFLMPAVGWAIGTYIFERSV